MFLIRLGKIIWASPYTILGLMIGLVGLCTRGRVLRRWPLEFGDGGVCWLLEHLPSDYVIAKPPDCGPKFGSDESSHASLSYVASMVPRRIEC